MKKKIYIGWTGVVFAMFLVAGVIMGYYSIIIKFEPMPLWLLIPYSILALILAPYIFYHSFISPMFIYDDEGIYCSDRKKKFLWSEVLWVFTQLGFDNTTQIAFQNNKKQNKTYIVRFNKFGYPNCYQILADIVKHIPKKKIDSSTKKILKNPPKWYRL